MAIDDPQKKKSLLDRYWKPAVPDTQVDQKETANKSLLSKYWKGQPTTGIVENEPPSIDTILQKQSEYERKRASFIAPYSDLISEYDKATTQAPGLGMGPANRKQLEKQFPRIDEYRDYRKKLEEWENENWEPIDTQKIKELRKRVDRTVKQITPSIRLSSFGGNIHQPDMPRDYVEQVSRKQRLQTASDMLRSAEKLGEEGVSKEGIEGIRAGIKSGAWRDFATVGMRELASIGDLSGIANKRRSGEELSDEEDALLQAYGTLQYMQGNPNQSLTYEVTKGVKEMLPYMVQFALTSGIGTLAKQGAVKLLGYKLVKKGLQKKVLKPLLYTIGSAAQTPFLPLGYQDYFERTVGEVTPEGELIAGTEQTGWEAIWKAGATAFSEVFSENLGGYFGKPFSFVGKKGGQLGRSTMNVVDRFAKAARFDGWLAEYGEEVVNSFMQTVITGDQTLKEAFDPRTQLVTLLTVAAVGGGMYGISGAKNLMDKQALKSKLASLPEDVQEKLTKAVERDDPNVIGNELYDVLNSGKLSPGQKEDAVEFTLRTVARNADDNGRKAARVEKSARAAERIDRLGSATIRSDGSIVTATMGSEEEGSPVWVLDGNATTNPETGVTTISDKVVTVVDKDGNKAQVGLNDLFDIEQHDAQEYLDQAREKEFGKATMEQLREDVADGVEKPPTIEEQLKIDELKVGKTVIWRDKDGNETTVVVESEPDQNGNLSVGIPETDESVVVPIEEVVPESEASPALPVIEDEVLGGTPVDTELESWPRTITVGEEEYAVNPIDGQRAEVGAEMETEEEASQKAESLQKKYPGLTFTITNKRDANDPTSPNQFFISARKGAPKQTEEAEKPKKKGKKKEIKPPPVSEEQVEKGVKGIQDAIDEQQVGEIVEGKEEEEKPMETPVIDMKGEKLAGEDKVDVEDLTPENVFDKGLKGEVDNAMGKETPEEQLGSLKALVEKEEVFAPLRKGLKTEFNSRDLANKMYGQLKEQAEKKPWEMTQKEYLKTYPDKKIDDHETDILEAIGSEKDVPDKVLQDYPKLREEKKKKDDEEARFKTSKKKKPEQEKEKTKPRLVTKAKPRFTEEFVEIGKKDDKVPEGNIETLVERTISNLEKKVKRGARFKWVDKKEELPDHIKATMPKNARVPGVYDEKTDTIYMVRSETTSAGDAVLTWVHERGGHNGLKILLGEDYDKVLTSIYDSVGHEKIIEGLDQAEVDRYTRGGNIDKIALADEYMARLTEKLVYNEKTGQFDMSKLDTEEKSIWKKFVAAVKKLLKKAQKGVEFTDQEVERIAHAGMQAVFQDGQTRGRRGTSPRFMVIGEKGVSRALNRRKIIRDLEVAKQMEGKKSPREIKMSTGWERGADKKWKYEIPDELGDFVQKFSGLAKSSIFDIVNPQNTLGNLMGKSKLFEYYPELKDVTVTKESAMLDLFGSTQGWYNPITNTLNITPYADNVPGTLVHELQHIIQGIEGFARGSSMELVLDYMPESELKSISDQVTEDLYKTIKEETDSKEAHKKLKYITTGTKDKIDVLQKRYKELNDKADEIYQRVKDKYKGKNPFTSDPEIKAVREKQAKVREQVMEILGSVDEALRFNGANVLVYGIDKGPEVAITEATNKINNATEQIAKISEANTREELKEALGDKASTYSGNAYQRVAGEVEARNVTNRMKLKENERRMVMLGETEDIADQDKIFIFGGPTYKTSGVRLRTADQEAAKELLEKYEETGEIGSIGGLVEELEFAEVDGVSGLIYDYYEAIREDRELWGMRGDNEEYQVQFLQGLRNFIDEDRTRFRTPGSALGIDMTFKGNESGIKAYPENSQPTTTDQGKLPKKSPYSQPRYRIIAVQQNVRQNYKTKSNRVFGVSIQPEELANIPDNEAGKVIKSLEQARQVTANPERVKDWHEKIYANATPMPTGKLKKKGENKLDGLVIIDLTQGCQRSLTTVERVVNGILPSETRVESCYEGDCWVNLQFNRKFDDFENMEVRDLLMIDKGWLNGFAKRNKKSLMATPFIRHGQRGDDSHAFATGLAEEWLKSLKEYGITTPNVFISAGYAPVTREQYKALLPYKDQFVIHFSNSGWFHKNEIMLRLAEYQTAREVGLNAKIRIITNKDNISGVSMENEIWLQEQLIDLGVPQQDILETPYHDDEIKKKNIQKRSDATGEYRYVCCESGKCKTCGPECLSKFIKGQKPLNVKIEHPSQPEPQTTPKQKAKDKSRYRTQPVFKGKEVDEVNQRAMEEFGLTDDFNEAGYLLPEGELLALRQQGREFDHRNISSAFYRYDEETDEETEIFDPYPFFDNRTWAGSSSPNMYGYMLTGAIRVKPEYGGVEIAVKPTPDQVRQLRKYFNSLNGRVTLDLSDIQPEFVNTHSVDYNRNTPTERIINDILNYFDNGVRPVAPRVRFRTSPQVDSKAFKDWFGESKVVDKDGNPLVVYHSTKKDFDVFKKKNLSDGYFFSGSPNVNMTPRLWDAESPYQEGSNIMPVFLNIKNPKRLYDISSDPLQENKEISLAKEQGHDGLLINEGTWVAFSPTQIKSAIGNRGTFDPTNADIRYRAVPLYSPTQEAIGKVSQGKGTPDQWKAQLLKNGAKKAEMEWMGWDEFAKGKESLTRADVQAWANANNIELQEVVKGKESNESAQVQRARERKANAEQQKSRIEYQLGGKVFLTGNPIMWYYRVDHPEQKDNEAVLVPEEYQKELTKLQETINRYDELTEALDFMEPFGEERENVRYSEYVLPGGENYQEWLLTMPTRTDKAKVEERDGLWYIVWDNGNTSYGYDTQKAAEEEIAERKRLLEAGDIRDKADYRSSHWATSNIVVHVRTNERIDQEGDKVLFIEEMQSDWAQEGKKKGYAPNSEEKKEIDRLLKVYNKVAEETLQYYNEISEGGNLSTPYLIEQDTPEGRKFKKLTEDSNKALAEWEEYKDQFGQVPDMPFKQTPEWTKLALSRMVVYASQNGFDRVAWTTGEQQVARYDLSKAVQDITVEDSEQEGYEKRITIKYKYQPGTTGLAVDKDGKVVMGSNQFTGKQLDAIVGKEVAEKIMQSEGKTILTEPDLKVGGKGMKAFYDNILPSVAKKLVKKFGGNVEETQIGESKPIEWEQPEEQPEGYTIIRSKDGAFTIFDKTDYANIVYMLNENGEEVFTNEGKTVEDFKQMAEGKARQFAPSASYGFKANSITLPESLKQEAREKGLPRFRTPGDMLGIPKVYAEPVYVENEGWAVKTFPHKYDYLGGTSLKTYKTKEEAERAATKESDRIVEKIKQKDKLGGKGLPRFRTPGEMLDLPGMRKNVMYQDPTAKPGDISNDGVGDIIYVEIYASDPRIIPDDLTDWLPTQPKTNAPISLIWDEESPGLYIEDGHHRWREALSSDSKIGAWVSGISGNERIPGEVLSSILGGPAKDVDTGMLSRTRDKAPFSFTRNELIEEAIESGGFSRYTAGQYVDYLRQITKTENNDDIGDPLIHLETLREASRIIETVKGKPGSGHPDTIAGNDVAETIYKLKELDPKTEEDKTAIEYRLQILEDYQDYIDELVNNALEIRFRTPGEAIFGGTPQTEPSAFKKWFGKSKVVDEEGKPLVGYKAMIGTVPRVHPDSKLTHVALEYSVANEFWKPGREIQDVYVKSENPWDFRDSNHVNKLTDILTTPDNLKNYREWHKEVTGWERDVDDKTLIDDLSAGIEEGAYQILEWPVAIDEIKKMGHDGIYMNEDNNTSNAPNIAVFSPSQIKSATGNRGTFDPTDSDIRFRTVDPAKDEWELLKDQWHGNRDWAATKASLEASVFQDKIKESFKGHQPIGAKTWQDVDRAMHIYLDMMASPLDSGLYWHQLSEEQKRIVRMAEDLSDEQKKIAAEIQKQYVKTGLEALDAGVISNILDNYVARMWNLDDKKTGETEFWRSFGTSTRHAKKRTLGTIIEGWAKGYKLRIEGATNNLSTLKTEIANTIESRRLIEEGIKIKTLDGKNLFSTTNREGYKMIEHPNFRRWMPIWGLDLKNMSEEEKLDKDLIVTKDGTILRKRIIYAPEPIAKEMNKVLGKPFNNPLINTLTQLNAIAKATILSWSFFHHQAFLRSYLFGSALGTNIKNMDPVAAYKEGMQLAKDQAPIVEHLVRNGLTLGRIQDWDEMMIHRKTKLGDKLDELKVLPGVRRRIMGMHDRHSDFLFKTLGVGLKVKTAILEYQHLQHKHPNADPNFLAKLAARQTNADFGGLHLERMGRSKKVQHIMRLLLLAPDWTESNVQSMVKAMQSPTLINAHRKMRGRESLTDKEKEEIRMERNMYRRFWARVAVRGAMATTMLNMAMAFWMNMQDDGDDDDKKYWDQLMDMYEKMFRQPQKMNFLAVDFTPMYNAMNKIMNLEPEEMEEDVEVRKYFSLIGHFKDPIKFIVRPFLSAQHKGSVLFKTAYEALRGQDWKENRYTTFKELRGKDDKGVYMTTSEERGYRAGDPKGGKLKGKTTKYDMKSRYGPLKIDEVPSYVLNQARSLLPIPIQNTIALMQGEIDWYDAASKGFGFHTSSTIIKKSEELEKEYKKITDKAKLRSTMIRDAERYNEADKLRELKTDEFYPKAIFTQKLEKKINKLEDRIEKLGESAGEDATRELKLQREVLMQMVIDRYNEKIEEK